MKSKNENFFIAWIILIILAFIWGSSFILIKKSLLYFSANEVGALRIVFAFVFLIPFSIYRFKKLGFRKIALITIIGLFGNIAPAFLFAYAQKGLDSNLAGVLNSITPLFTFLIALTFFGFKSKWYNIIGIFIALAGAVGLTSVSGGHDLQFNIGYAAYILIATLCYATNVNLIKYFLKDIDIISITVFSFLIPGFLVLIYLFAGTPILQTIENNPEFWKGVIYVGLLGIVGTALALLAFNKLIKISNPVIASSVTYMIPIVALMWGILDGEKFETIYLLYILLILSGVYLVNKKKDKR
ncbi:DMT family transporter [Bacteroidota bacterium]